MIKAFAHELIFGWLGVLEANLLRCAHCCIEMEIAARHVFRLRKTWRGIIEGLYIKIRGVHNRLQIETIFASALKEPGLRPGFFVSVIWL